MRVRLAATSLSITLAGLGLIASPAEATAPCVGTAGSTCGVGADPAAGEFHGLIAVHGSPWLLADAAHSGTKPGCGDCTWSVVLACPAQSPGDPGGTGTCVTSRDSPACHRRQLLYRIYLTTDAVSDRVIGTICLGGGRQPIPIGNLAAAAVDRYLRNVVPPDLAITTRPSLATLAGLATYFTAATPASMHPTRFGGPTITERITIAPSRADWHWGDSEVSGWAPVTARLRHSYARGGTAHGRLLARWGATYTISYQGRTFGPYDATGHVTKEQDFVLPVDTSSPTLVSH
jgi:hypothetical protein